jgi:hypothetical protein
LVRSSIFLDVSIIVRALAADHLAATVWASFHIATRNVKLHFEHSAVMAWLTVCSPIVLFLAIPNSGTEFAADAVCGAELRLLNPLWPAFDHANALINYEFVWHR